MWCLSNCKTPSKSEFCNLTDTTSTPQFHCKRPPSWGPKPASDVKRSDISGSSALYQTPSRLDFSHLSQTGWSRSPPICSKRGHVKAPTRPAFPILTTKLAAALRKGHSETSRARIPGSISHPLGALFPVLLLVHTRGGDFGLWRPRRLFACWPPTPTRKKPPGHLSDLKLCALLCRPMAKVELGNCLINRFGTHERPRSIA